ncbi:hypothetical protein GOQ27_13345 [Clostridium sp. D2Q-11]|uniref:Uncharacterized protein n=1 Tax=Anaeromonas frigoriresistens TaxID=2683708 RepID=A0A942UXM3_9FIRM|nr:hypothetical protein [Anaeromonas frigoriresistens]MBS4539455.1 hypothetical protein [Anaeromonas frigoriresistens]
MLERSDIALMIYIGFMIFAWSIGYIFDSKMIKKTGLFGSQTLIVSVINFSIGFCVILGWFFFSWGVNEFIFFGGLILGIGMLVASQVALLILLLVKKKQMMQIYNNNINNNS